MKLWIDDIRDAPDASWTVVRHITEAIRFIAMFGREITNISIDHDISFGVSVQGTQRPFPSPDTFQAVAFFMGLYYFNNSMRENRPVVTVHSANPVGGRAIVDILARYEMESTFTPMPAVNRFEAI